MDIGSVRGEANMKVAPNVVANERTQLLFHAHLGIPFLYHGHNRYSKSGYTCNTAIQ